MRRETLLSRLLMAVTLLVAALMLAPSEAQAHAGHSHAIQPAAPTAVAAAGMQDIEAAPITARGEVTISQTSGRSASLLPSSSPDTPQSCPGGCCHSAGSGCCAVWLPASIEISVPAPGRLPRIVSVIGASGITPGALPEPPNALV